MDDHRAWLELTLAERELLSVERQAKINREKDRVAITRAQLAVRDARDRNIESQGSPTHWPSIKKMEEQARQQAVKAAELADKLY